MRTIFKFILLICFLVLSLVDFAQKSSKDSLHFEVLLTGKILTDAHIKSQLLNNFDITSSRLILLSTSNRFYLLGWGGMGPFGKKTPGNIEAFAVTRDSSLLVIHDTALCTFDSSGNLTRLFKLPHRDMGIASGNSALYIYDKTNSIAKHSLYVVVQGGKYLKLVDSPTPINSVLEAGESVLFASGNKLFRFTPKNKKMETFVELPNDNSIRSIAADTVRKTIYFSTDNAIYAVKDSSIALLTNKLTGSLKYYKDGLMVFNPGEKSLIRIDGIEMKESDSKK